MIIPAENRSCPAPKQPPIVRIQPEGDLDQLAYKPLIPEVSAPLSPIPGLLREGLVWVVDNEKCNRNRLRKQLECEGCRVIFMDDGEQVLQAVGREIPDAILLDIMMPHLDGYSVCRAIRQNPRTTHVPVLMVTALADRAHRLAGIEAGANDFLSKPIDAHEIRLRVRNAVYAKQLYDQVQNNLQRLRQLEDLRDRLVHMIVHDMSNPLLSISLTLDRMIHEAAKCGLRWDVEPRLAQESCRCLESMISSMLDISRMESGNMPLNRERHSILEISHEAAHAVSPLAEEKNLNLLIGGQAGHALVDREILRRIVVNLLGNAIKFSPPGGVVEVDVSSGAGSVRVEVRDQGCGIPPEEHVRIFEKFAQVKSPEPCKGHGLGLAFCRLAVETHGGQIGVRSQVGVGSTFWLTLPAAPPVPGA